MSSHFVALHTLHLPGAGGKAVIVNARGAKVRQGVASGVFTGLPGKLETSLTDRAAIRTATKAEVAEATDIVSLTENPLDHDADGSTGGSLDELDQMKVAELKELAGKENIDLGEATKRDEILAAIRASRAAGGDDLLKA